MAIIVKRPSELGPFWVDPTSRSNIDKEDVRECCSNIGVDLSCSACRMLFYTNTPISTHDANCGTHPEIKRLFPTKR